MVELTQKMTAELKETDRNQRKVRFLKYNILYLTFSPVSRVNFCPYRPHPSISKMYCFVCAQKSRGDIPTMFLSEV